MINDVIRWHMYIATESEDWGEESFSWKMNTQVTYITSYI